MLTSLFARLRQRFANGSADSAKSSDDAASSKGVFSRGAVMTIVGFVLVGTFAALFVHAATTGANNQSSVMNVTAQFLSSILFVLVGFVGQLLLIMVGALVWVAQYNGFVNSAAVAQGWSICRDITNMFFILVLLVLAFGTILGVESWGIAKGGSALTRLLIMAVVVNFSRTICGLIIDFGQVVMLTFVYGFKDAAGGNFTDAFGLTQILQTRTLNANETVDTWGIAISFLLALAMTVIALLVVVGMTVTLVMRVVYLWLLIVLSPIAFFLKAVPGSKAASYYKEWWGKFTGLVVVGPVMAFTLWLSLLSVATPDLATRGFGASGPSDALSGGISQAFTTVSIQKFIIGICLMVAGWQLSQDISKETAGSLPSVAGAGKSLYKGAKSAASAAYRGGKSVAGGAYRAADNMMSGGLTDAKELGLGLVAGSRIPGLNKYAEKGLVSSIGNREAQRAEAAKHSSALAKSPEALASAATRKAYTADQKIAKVESMREYLKQKAEKPPTDAAGIAQVQAVKKDFLKTGKEMGDSSVDKFVSDIEKKRPSFVLDASEKDPKKRQENDERYAKLVRAKSGNDIAGMDKSELTPAFMAFANPKAMVAAQTNVNTSGEANDLLSAYGKDETEVRARQAADKDKPEMFNMLSAQERAAKVFAMPRNDLQNLASNDQVRPESLAGAVVAEAAKAGNADVIADKVASQLTAAQLQDKDGKPNDLAQQIANGISASKLGTLAPDIASVILPLVGKGDAAKALAGGVAVDQVFTGIGNDGNFDTADNRKNFEDYLQGGLTSKRAGSVPAAVIGANGGINDVSISMVNNLEAEDVASMAKDGKVDQVSEIMSAIEKLSKVDGGNPEELKQLIEKNPGLKALGDELKNSIDKAKTLMKDMGGKIDPVGAAAKSAASESENAAKQTRELGRNAEKRRKRA
jgi:hypothetical protein